MKFALEKLAAHARELEWEVARKFGPVAELDMRQCLQLQKIDWLHVQDLADETESGYTASQKHWCRVLREICQHDAAALQAIDAVLASHQSERYDESLGKPVQWDTREVEAARQNMQARIDSLKPKISGDLNEDIKRRAEAAVLYSEAILALCSQQGNREVAGRIARLRAAANSSSYDAALVQTMQEWAQSM